MNQLSYSYLQPPPQVSILPLGTGNDLSRVLGWGEGYTGDVDVKHILELLDKAHVVKLDRWRVNITPAKKLGIRMPARVCIILSTVRLYIMCDHWCVTAVML